MSDRANTGIFIGDEYELMPFEMYSNRSERPVESEHVSFQCTIFRNGETCKLKHLVFETDLIQTIDEFKDVVRGIKFTLSLGGTYYMENNLGFFTELNDVVKNGNKFSIFVPFDVTMGEIMTQLISWHNCDVRLSDMKSNIFSCVTLIVGYNSSKLNAFSENIQHVKPMQNLRDESIDLVGDRCGAQGHIEITRSNERIKGIFVQGNVSEISEMSLRINNRQHIAFDSLAIALYCHQISSNMFYYSFDGNKNYQLDTTCKSSLDASKCESVRLEFKTQSVGKLMINILSTDSIEYGKGMCRRLN
jgi:hypothetical protein